MNAEPTDLGALTLHAGAFNFEIELEGVTRHVSKREEAVDAVAAAAALVPRVNAITFSGAARPTSTVPSTVPTSALCAGPSRANSTTGARRR